MIEPPAYGMIVLKKALLIRIAIDVNNKGHRPSKSFLAGFKKINDQNKRDKQGPGKEHHGGIGK